MSDFIGISMPAHLDNPMAPVPAGTQMYPLHPGQRENHQPASSQPYAPNSTLGHSQSASFGPYSSTHASPVSAPMQSQPPPPLSQNQQQQQHMRRGQSYASPSMMPPPISTNFPGSGSNSPRYAHSPAAAAAGAAASPYHHPHHLPPSSKRGSYSLQSSPHAQLAPPYSPGGAATSAYYSPDLAQQQQQQQQEIYNLARQAGHQTPYYSPRVPNSPAASSSPAGSLRHQSPSSAPPHFKRVQDPSDLKPLVHGPATNRRADPAGGFISPLKSVTTNLLMTFHQVNPAFTYEPSHNPRRVLTKPSTKGGNDGYDNEDSDYILYVNDWLGSDEGNKYLILDLLGQGTFGQVVKCQNMKTNEIVAVKVIKNKPAYYNQSMMEVTILDLLNNTWDASDEHHLLRLKDQFIHHRHLCLVFELLSVNLYELIKQNSFRGLSSSLVRVFTGQLLDSLTVLNEARLIHCDLKPENILLKSLQSPNIKVIDFGSACHEKQTVYTYIQSRFYRAPEVLLGLPYNSGIDMWSLGCICVELFLGLPLFPGTSEYNQLSRIIEMLGMPPTYMLDVGKQTGQFFDAVYDSYSGSKSYRFKSIEQYSAEHGTQEQPSKRYFNANTLPDIINSYPMAKKDAKPSDIEKEMNTRRSFIDFVQGLLNLDPTERWTPQQAKHHPFVNNEPLTKPFVPPPDLKEQRGKVQTPQMAQGQPPQPTQSIQTSQPPAATQVQQQQQQQLAQQPYASSASSASDSKRPYGGLISQPSSASSKPYQDAASYNRHLSQQQSYNALQAANAYRQSQMPTNPYTEPPSAAQMKPPPPPQGPYGYVGNPPPAAHPAQHYSNRTRIPYNASDSVPLQLQRLAMEMANGTGVGKSMTPVLKRDDQTRAWERRQGGGGNDGLSRKVSIRHHPALDLLTQQAELGYRVGGGGRQPIYQGYSPRQQGFPASANMPHMPIEQPQMAHTLQQGNPAGQPPMMPMMSMAPPASQGQPSLYDNPLDGREMGMYTPMQASNLPPVSPRTQQAAYAQQQQQQNMDPASMPYGTPAQPNMGYWQNRHPQHPQNPSMWP